MEETWALPVITWFLTPALIAGVLIALAQLYDPQTRWSRRLKSDLSIAGGLPTGPERSAWERSVSFQAMRLREYREAFVGWTLLLKWGMVALVGVGIFGTVLYPPINEPGDRYPFVPGDYMMLVMGGVCAIAYAVFIGTGRDFLGRTPRQIILRRRVRRYDRRWRRLMRLEKAREALTKGAGGLRQKGSRLGFSTQVDQFGVWARDSDLRGLARSAGFVSADFDARYRANLRKRDVSIPPWPDLPLPKSDTRSRSSR